MKIHEFQAGLEASKLVLAYSDRGSPVTLEQVAEKLTELNYVSDLGGSWFTVIQEIFDGEVPGYTVIRAEQNDPYDYPHWRIIRV